MISNGPRERSRLCSSLQPTFIPFIDLTNAVYLLLRRRSRLFSHLFLLANIGFVVVVVVVLVLLTDCVCCVVGDCVVVVFRDGMHACPTVRLLDSSSYCSS